MKLCKWLCILIPVLGVCLFYRVFDPMEHTLMPLCPLKMLTGLSCPICGIQRAAHAFLTGEFAQAFRYNYYLVVAIPCTICYAVCRFVYCKEGASGTVWLSDRLALFVILGSLFIWFAVRNIFGI